jgi:hypothetical protein
MKAKHLTQELLDLIIKLNNNANAYDDDLKETWNDFLRQWDNVKESLDNYIAEDN